MSHLPFYKWNQQSDGKSLMTPMKRKVQLALHPQLEEIMKKDLLKPSESLKLMPDYVPPDPSILMKMRRLSVRPGLYQGTKKIIRPKLKHNKDTSIVNRELMRLKDELKLKNIQNKITMQYGQSVYVKLMNKKVYINNVFIEEIDSEYNVDESKKIQPTEVEDQNYENKDTQIQVTQICKKITKNNIDSLKDHTTKSSDGKASQNNSTHIEYDRITSGNEIPFSFMASNYHRKEIIKDLRSNVIERTFNKISDAPAKPKLNICSEKVLVYKTDEEQQKDSNEILKTRVECDEHVANLDLRQKYLKAKYYDKWRRSLTKNVEIPMIQRKEIIDKFFDKLLKEKEMLKGKENNNSASNCLSQNYSKDSNGSKQSSHLSNYQHRYRTQKNIIALQKYKLEQQNRLIEELKYNKIVDATRTSINELKDEVTGLDNNIDRKMKPKVKLLTNELHIHEIQEPSLVLHCLKVPQFLQKMEQRARVREEKHAMIRERRKQMDEEKLRLKQQAELEKLEMDRDERERRVAELRDKRIKEKMELIRKKQHEERIRSLFVMADLHYEKKLLLHGFGPWVEMVKERRDNYLRAEQHYKFALRKNTFLNWMWKVEDAVIERNYKADDLYRKKLMRKVIDALKKNRHEYILKRQVADDYYDFYLVKLIFTKWRENAMTEKMIYDAKEQKAIEHHESNILFKSLTHWSSLPKLMCIQREREARKARWRHKVLQVVPDYTPQEDY